MQVIEGSGVEGTGLSTLGCIGIGIIEAGKILGVFQIPEVRDAVARPLC
jgi:hypothetical protein